MKILKIAFKNINSLKGEHQIDFSKAPFNTSSLFAITGPTGSGKSTILDVIALALFNKIPRLPGNRTISRSDIEKFGAILTRNQKEAYAQVTYKGKNGTFSSQWSISTNRNNKLRDYEMQIFDIETGKALDLKKSDVPAKNEDLIGLNYDQFIKAVLLAQGEFAQFLKAPKDERGELLEKITGTGIYRKLGISTYQKYQEEHAEIQGQEKEIEILKRELLDEESLKKHTTELLNKENACKPLKETLEKLNKSLKLKGEIKHKQNEILNLKKEEEKAKNALENFNKTEGMKLLRHEKVQVFAEEIRKWDQIKSVCSNLETEVHKKSKDFTQNQKNIEDCIEEVCSFTKQKINPTQLEESLQNFASKVNDLERKRLDKRSTYHSTKQLFERETREINFQLNGKLEESQIKLNELKTASDNKLLQLETDLKNIKFQEIPQEKIRLQQEYNLTRKAVKQAGILEKITSEIKRIETEEKELTDVLKELPQAIEEAKNKRDLLLERLEKLQLKQKNELLTKKLEHHRHLLKSGEACPLCGALEHPYAHRLPPKQEGLVEEIKQTETNLDHWKQKLTSAATQLDANKNRIASFESKKKLLQEEFQNEKKSFNAKFQELKNLSEVELEAHCEKTQQQLTKLEVYEQEKRKSDAIKAGLPLLNELQEIFTAGKIISEQLKQLYSGENFNEDVQRLQNKWTRLKEEEKSLQKQLKEVENERISQKDKCKEIEQKLLPKLKQLNCSGLTEAAQMLLAEKEYMELRKKREQLNAAIEKASTVLQTLCAQLEELVKNDLPKAEEALKEEIEQTDTNLSGLNTACEELRRKINNHREQLEKVEYLEAQIEEKSKKIKRWRLLNELIGDSKGKRFNDFAQDLTLSQLLALANIRLKTLSDRYRIDKPSKNEDDGLVAIDEHMGGQRRSVKTLSGGETFILSLSMALALSDLASKNVEINSLFIDEGFGTLDPETLDQTLDTLEKLQAESSKTIGIISHVDSLKERISTQIQLKRNGQGYSDLEVK